MNKPRRKALELIEANRRVDVLFRAFNETLEAGAGEAV